MTWRLVPKSAPTLDALFVVGKRRSGKSAYFERELLKYECRVYVGTVRLNDETLQMIREHRERRGAGWRLVELDGDRLAADEIERVIKDLDPRCACLIDGLMNWAMLWSEASGDLLGAAFAVARALAFIVCDNPHVTWRLLDVPSQTFEEEGMPLEAVACTLLHRTLRTEIAGLRSFIFDNGRLHEHI